MSLDTLSRSPRRLEREGIEAARVHWNLSHAGALRGGGPPSRRASSPPSGPLVCRTGQHTGRSPNDKFIVQEPSSDAAHRLGRRQPADGPAQFETCFGATSSGHFDGASCSCRTATPAPIRRYRLPVRVITEYAWHSLFARNLFIVAESAARQRHAAVHDHRRAQLQGRPGAARHALRGRHRAELREAAGADRRDELRRRDQEVDLHRAELPAAASGRAVDALLGEHRARRATPRSSSASRARARRRCRAIRSAA